MRAWFLSSSAVINPAGVLFAALAGVYGAALLLFPRQTLKFFGTEKYLARQTVNASPFYSVWRIGGGLMLLTALYGLFIAYEAQLTGIQVRDDPREVTAPSKDHRQSMGTVILYGAYGTIAVFMFLSGVIMTISPPTWAIMANRVSSFTSRGRNWYLFNEEPLPRFADVSARLTGLAMAAGGLFFLSPIATAVVRALR